MNVVTMQRGRFGHRPRNDPRYYGGEYPFIQTGSVVNASYDNSKIEFSQTLNELGLSTSRLCSEKSLLITIAANIGYSAILDYAACFPDSIVALKPVNKKISIEYLNVYLRSIRSYVELLAPQAAQKNINQKQLSPIPIIVPPSSIQHRIVEIMDGAYDRKKQKEKEAHDLLESINSYLLDELGIAMPPEEENTIKERMFYTQSKDVLGGRYDPFFHKKIYDKYDNAIHLGDNKIKKLGCFIKYITYGASVDNCYTESGIPLLRIKDLKPNKIDSKDVVFLPIEMEKKLRTSRLTTNDILISRSGTIGVCSVVDETHDGYAFGSFMIKFSVSNINPQYIAYVINSDIGKNYFERHRIGAIQGNITIPVIESMPIPTPPVEKQNTIVKNINNIRKRAKNYMQQATNAVETAKSQVEKILLEGNT